MKIMLDEFLIMMDTLTSSISMNEDIARKIFSYHKTDRKRVWLDLHKRMKHLRLEKIKTLDPDVDISEDKD